MEMSLYLHNLILDERSIVRAFRPSDEGKRECGVRSEDEDESSGVQNPDFV